MSDSDLHEDLQAWIDGELGPERAAEMRAAVERDEALARRAAELRALEGLLDTLPGAVPTPGFGSRVALAARKERPAWRRHWVGAAAAACVLVTAVLILNPFKQPRDDPGEESWLPLVPPETVKVDDIEQIVSDIEWIDDEFLATGR